MLTLKDNTLTTSESLTIDSNDYTLKLTADNNDCYYFGIITLSNKALKTIQFIKINSIYKARILISKEELNYLDNSKIKIVSSSANFTKESNSIPLYFNKDKIKLTIKQETSKEIFELKQKISLLETKLNSLSLGKPITNVLITNKEYIQPGMTLVAIDNTSFIAAYPFADIIKKVNGQQAVDGVVEIDASMIKYNTERSIEEQFTVIGDAIKTQNQTLKTISSELNTLSKKLADLTIKVETHLDNGII